MLRGWRFLTNTENDRQLADNTKTIEFTPTIVNTANINGTVPTNNTGIYTLYGPLAHIWFRLRTTGVNLFGWTLDLAVYIPLRPVLNNQSAARTQFISPPITNTFVNGNANGEYCLVNVDLNNKGVVQFNGNSSTNSFNFVEVSGWFYRD